MRFQILAPVLAVAVARIAAAAEEAKRSEGQAELCSAQYQAFQPTWSDVILVIGSGEHKGMFKLDHQSPPNLYFYCQKPQGIAPGVVTPLVSGTYLTHKGRLTTVKIFDANHPVTQNPLEVQVIEVDPPGGVK